MEFRQYDVVRLKELPSHVNEQGDAFNLRQPVVGDIATIIEIYSKPLGYELECSDSAGVTQWLIAFHPDEIELELV